MDARYLFGERYQRICCWVEVMDRNPVSFRSVYLGKMVMPGRTMCLGMSTLWNLLIYLLERQRKRWQRQREVREREKSHPLVYIQMPGNQDPNSGFTYGWQVSNFESWGARIVDISKSKLFCACISLLLLFRYWFPPPHFPPVQLSAC